MRSIVAQSDEAQKSRAVQPATMSWRRAIVICGFSLLCLLPSCERDQKAPPGVTDASPTPVPRMPTITGDPAPTLLLAKAQFTYQIDHTGRRRAVPGAAKLVILRQTPDGWREQTLEDPTSLVFHKALPIRSADGSVKLLTIAGSAAALKEWDLREQTHETLWQPAFGGTWDRLRDIEIGDVTGDGVDEMVVATHDRGVVGVLSRGEDGWDVTELGRTTGRTFVHEIEIGDADGDGVAEFFATPSKPNQASGASQDGEIVMYRYRDGAWDRVLVEKLVGTHAKEILAVDLDGRGRCRLFAAIEARAQVIDGQMRAISPVIVREYRYENGSFSTRDIATLDDRQCRFLCAGDVNGDGRRDMVATGMNSGVWLLEQGDDNTWSKLLIDGDSSAYEHALLVADLDGRGTNDIIVAADREKELRRYRWQDGEFQREIIARLPAAEITFHVAWTRL